MPPKCNVYIASLPLDYTEDRARQLAAPYGRIQSTRFFNDNQSAADVGHAYCFVMFESEAQATDCVRGLNGLEIDNRRLQVKFARGPPGGSASRSAAPAHPSPTNAPLHAAGSPRKHNNPRVHQQQHHHFHHHHHFVGAGNDVPSPNSPNAPPGVPAHTPPPPSQVPPAAPHQQQLLHPQPVVGPQHQYHYMHSPLVAQPATMLVGLTAPSDAALAGGASVPQPPPPWLMPATVAHGSPAAAAVAQQHATWPYPPPSGVHLLQSQFQQHHHNLPTTAWLPPANTTTAAIAASMYPPPPVAPITTDHGGFAPP